MKIIFFLSFINNKEKELIDFIKKFLNTNIKGENNKIFN